MKKSFYLSTRNKNYTFKSTDMEDFESKLKKIEILECKNKKGELIKYILKPSSLKDIPGTLTEDGNMVIHEALYPYIIGSIQAILKKNENINKKPEFPQEPENNMFNSVFDPYLSEREAKKNKYVSYTPPPPMKEDDSQEKEDNLQNSIIFPLDKPKDNAQLFKSRVRKETPYEKEDNLQNSIILPIGNDTPSDKLLYSKQNIKKMRDRRKASLLTPDEKYAKLEEKYKQLEEKIYEQEKIIKSILELSNNESKPPRAFIRGVYKNDNLSILSMYGFDKSEICYYPDGRLLLGSLPGLINMYSKVVYKILCDSTGKKIESVMKTQKYNTLLFSGVFPDRFNFEVQVW
ncbi:MAG: hypothetical protein ACOCRK_04325 [bacterium]